MCVCVCVGVGGYMKQKNVCLLHTNWSNILVKRIHTAHSSTLYVARDVCYNYQVLQRVIFLLFYLCDHSPRVSGALSNITVRKLKKANPNVTVVQQHYSTDLSVLQHSPQTALNVHRYGGLLRTILSKHFHGQSTEFSWANTNFNSQNPHIFVLSTFSWSKYVTLWQTYFHGQSATFS